MIKMTPRSAWDRFTAGDFVLEIVIAICAATAAILSGLRFTSSVPPQWALANTSFGSAGIAFIAVVWRAVRRNNNEQHEAELHALDGVIYTIHAILTANVAAVASGTVRVCVFVKAKNADTVVQVTNYVGVDERTGIGRDLPIQCGIVGKAFRFGGNHYDKLPANTHLTDFLVSEYGFDRSQASALRSDRVAWAAVAVGAPGDVVAVIYADSSVKDVFGNTNSTKRRALEAAVTGVAKFIANA